MIAAQTGGSICQVAGSVVLAGVIVFLLFVFFVLFCHVRPSSARRKVVWSTSDGWACAVHEHATASHLNGLVASSSRLKRAIAIASSSLGTSSWMDRWVPLFDGYKGSRGRWLGLFVALVVSLANGFILGFGVPLGTCNTEQVRGMRGTSRVSRKVACLANCSPMGSSEPVLCVLSLQGVMLGLAALDVVVACLWRPFEDPVYTIFDGVTAAGKFTLVAAMQLELSGNAHVPVEFLLTVSLAMLICNVGLQVRCPSVEGGVN